MNSSFVIYDTEYWTTEGAPSRCWNGIYDQPPLLIQIGAFKIATTESLPILGEYTSYLVPRDAEGHQVEITKFFTELTRITPEDIDLKGKNLESVMDEFKQFCGNDRLYSFGHDMLRTIVPSCFVQRITCPFDPQNARDIRHIFKRAGLSDEDLNRNSSGTLAEYLGVEMDSSHYPHDSRKDAFSLLLAARKLYDENRLSLDWF